MGEIIDIGILILGYLCCIVVLMYGSYIHNVAKFQPKTKDIVVNKFHRKIIATFWDRSLSKDKLSEFINQSTRFKGNLTRMLPLFLLLVYLFIIAIVFFGKLSNGDYFFSAIYFVLFFVSIWGIIKAWRFGHTLGD